MRRSLRHGTAAPLWANVLALSELFGIAPWQMEHDATQYWFERMAAYVDEVERHREREMKRQHGKS